MVLFFKKYFKSIKEISTHACLLFLSIIATVVLICLLPALLQLLVIFFVAFYK